MFRICRRARRRIRLLLGPIGCVNVVPHLKGARKQLYLQWLQEWLKGAVTTIADDGYPTIAHPGQ